MTMIDQSSFKEERKLLTEVFEQELRDEQLVWIYHYDQRYYKVLSACAKLRLKTKNLPEGNPTYIEVKDADWQTVINGQADAPAAEASSAQPAPAAPNPSGYNLGGAAPIAATPPSQPQAPLFQPAPTPAAAPAPAPEPIVHRVDPEQAAKLAEEAKQKSTVAREQSLKTREESVRVREQSVREREKAVNAAEQEISIEEETLVEKESRQSKREDSLLNLQSRLDKEAEKLRMQKHQVDKLSDNLAKVARNLMTEDV